MVLLCCRPSRHGVESYRFSVWESVGGFVAFLRPIEVAQDGCYADLGKQIALPTSTYNGS
jgi:hypothetical protein